MYMPLERIVEFKVGAPVELLPELIYFVGKTGAAMFENRHEKLPKPRDPPLLQMAKKLDDLLNQIAPYVQPQMVKLPHTSLERQMEEAIEKLEAIYREVSYYTRQLDELRVRLTTARDVANVKASFIPKTETLEVYVAVPGRAQREALELAKSLNAIVVQQDNALLIAIERQRATHLVNALEKMGARVYTYREAVETEPPHVIEEKIRNVERELQATLSKHLDTVNYAYTLKNAMSTIVEVFNKSATDEGTETGRLFYSFERELEKLGQQMANLQKIKTVLEGLAERGSVKLPQGFKFVVDPETPITSPHVIEKINGVTVALVRGEARGLEVPQEYLADIERGVRLVEEAIKTTYSTIQRLRRDYENLEKAYSEYSLYGDRKWEEHRDVASVMFYVLERDVSKVDNALVEFVRHNTRKIDIVKRVRYKYFDRVPPERRPTLERYPTPIRQFTNVTYMYGVPNPNEITPVPLVALIFPLFFGWMYGDLGHGFLLFLLGLLLTKKLYGGKYRDWGIVWTVTGLASMLFGLFVYQEAFGLHLKELGLKMPTPPVLHLFGYERLVEVEGVIASIRAAFLLGFLLMLMAFFAKFVNVWLKGERDMAIGLVLPQAFLFLSLSMIFLSLLKEGLDLHFLSPILNQPWPLIAALSIAWSVAGLMAIKARYRHHEEKPPAGEEFILGVVETSIAAFANIPSFARLVILILIHGVLTKLINSASASIGMPLGLVPAVLGHALIAAAEAFFSLVQTLRLTFYEVLSKFYEGRGRLFTPVTLP